MKLPDVRDFDLKDRTVLLRTDYDVPLQKTQNSKLKTQNWEVADETRIRDSLSTINHLLSKEAKVIILAHLGRPEGKIVQELSLSPVAEKLEELLPGINVKFQITNDKSILNIKFQIKEDEIGLMENLRFYSDEENNDPGFARRLASLGDFYVNNAFASSHREHASIVGLPKFLPHAAGLDLLEEVTFLFSVREKPKRPVVVILGGIKEDKLEIVGKLSVWADWVLIGGKLPTLISNFSRKAGSRLAGKFPIAKQQALLISNERIIIGTLGQEGKDLTLGTVEKFMEIIKKAGTIVWAGPMGEYEIKDYEHGTRMIAQAIIESPGFKIIGGGDTEAALTKFGLEKKIDFISSGGGAMLEFLAHGTLPGIKALVE